MIDRRAYLCLLAGITCVFGSQHATANTFTVNKGDVPGLIAAINASNVNGQDDIIVLSGFNSYTLTAIDNGVNGLPIIASDGGHKVTILGHGGKIQRTPTGSPPEFRIFQIAPGANVTIKTLPLVTAGCPPVTMVEARSTTTKEH